MYKMNLIVGDNDAKSMKEALLVDIRLRWIVSAVTVPVLILYINLVKTSGIIPFIVIAAVVAALNTAYYYIIQRDDKHLNALFAVTGLVDIFIVTLLIAFSGGMKSPLFLIYYFVLLDACFDYWSDRLYYY
ncbi:MAG TPA: DUF2985 domain-containing protein, partial [Candidatus Goldiibacteriota bacterium]|nr:DUF2985 domain-containing protein [Candidatus Goldiibacteriota bacterium]